SRRNGQSSQSRTVKKPATSRIPPRSSGVSKSGPSSRPVTKKTSKSTTGNVEVYEDGENQESEREDEQEPVSEYVLRNKTRNISRAVIDNRWKPMAPEVQERVKEIMESVERPII